MVQGAAPETSANPQTIGNLGMTGTQETICNPGVTGNPETTGNWEITVSSIEGTKLPRARLSVPTAEHMLLLKTQARSTATTARTACSACTSTTSPATGPLTVVD